MRRLLEDDSLIDSGNELRLTTVAGGSAEEGCQQPSASKAQFSLCRWSQTSELHKTGNLLGG